MEPNPSPEVGLEEVESSLSMDTSDYDLLGLIFFPELGLEEVESRLQEAESRLLEVESRLANLRSRVQKLGIRLEGPSRWLEGSWSSLEESQLLIIRAESIFGVSLGSGSMKWPKLMLNMGPIKPSETASDVKTWTPDEIRDHNEKLLNRLAPLFTINVKNAAPDLGPVAAALQEERKHQEKVLELEERQLALKIRLKRRGVGRSQRRRRASAEQRLRPRTRQLGHRLRFPWKQ